MFGFSALAEFALAEVPSAAITSVAADTSDGVDQLYYDWWRKKAKKDKRQKPKVAVRIDPPQEEVEIAPAPRIEAVEAIDARPTIEVILALQAEHAELRRIIAEYKRWFDEDEKAAEFYLLH